MGEAMFEEADANRDGKVDEGEFAALFAKCEQPEGDAAKVTSEDVARLFTNLDEESVGYLTKDSFTRILAVYMKVAKDTVMTSSMEIGKDSKTVCRLEIKDIVEVLQGPIKDDSVGVPRVQGKLV